MCPPSESGPAQTNGHANGPTNGAANGTTSGNNCTSGDIMISYSKLTVLLGSPRRIYRRPHVTEPSHPQQKPVPAGWRFSQQYFTLQDH